MQICYRDIKAFNKWKDFKFGVQDTKQVQECPADRELLCDFQIVIQEYGWGKFVSLNFDRHQYS